MKAEELSIIRRADLVEQPWKNGGGTTREIAASRSGANLRWRLSMADVATDGPFSRFEGLLRVLTVTAGNGMTLSAPNVILQADYGVPTWFSGDLDVASKLRDGPLQDVNLIFDPKIFDATVESKRDAAQVAIAARPGQTGILHLLKGSAILPSGETVNMGDTVFADGGAIHCLSFAPFDALIICLTFKSG